ncbi:MAG: hypothetical protein GX799_01770 [Crenarchaeota archaeon]|nr:hypothetical protein [Thermoproteota archaeon]
MDRQIILECQTRNDTLHCDDCIAYKTCKIREGAKKTSDISVVGLDTMGVWESWKKRKPLST